MIDEIQEWWAAMVQRIFEFFNGVIQGIEDAVTGVLEWFRDFFVGMWENYLLPWIETAIAWVKHECMSLINTVLGETGVSDWLDSNVGAFEDGIRFIGTINTFVPLAEAITGLKILVVAAVAAFGLRILVKVIRG